MMDINVLNFPDLNEAVQNVLRDFRVSPVHLPEQLENVLHRLSGQIHVKQLPNELLKRLTLLDHNGWGFRRVALQKRKGKEGNEIFYHESPTPIPRKNRPNNMRFQSSWNSGYRDAARFSSSS